MEELKIVGNQRKKHLKTQGYNRNMEMVNYHMSRLDASSMSGTGWWGFHKRSIGENLMLHNITACSLEWWNDCAHTKANTWVSKSQAEESPVFVGKGRGFCFPGCYNLQTARKGPHLPHTTNICPTVLPKESHCSMGDGQQAFWTWSQWWGRVWLRREECWKLGPVDQSATVSNAALRWKFFVTLLQVS